MPTYVPAVSDYGEVLAAVISLSAREQVAIKLEQLSRADFIRFVRSLGSSQADRVVLYSQGDAHQGDTSGIEGVLIDYLAEFQQNFSTVSVYLSCAEIMVFSVEPEQTDGRSSRWFAQPVTQLKRHAVLR